MHGLRGRPWRAKVIVAEFVLGAIAGLGLGLLVVVRSSGLGRKLFGLWVIGIGLNYVAFAFHAVSVYVRGGVQRELEGVDLRAELRYDTAAQIWVAVPLAIVVFALPARR